MRYRVFARVTAWVEIPSIDNAISFKAASYAAKDIEHPPYERDELSDIEFAGELDIEPDPPKGHVLTGAERGY